MKEIAGTICTPKGFYAMGVHCGLKKKKKDIGLIYSDVPASAAAVFTTNKVQAAPIIQTQKALKAGASLQAIIVNSAVANACTGQQGVKDAQAMQTLTAEKLGIEPEEVAVASTGVIGEPLNMEKIREGIAKLERQKAGETFHQAILTTDTCTKEVVVECLIQGKTVRIAGVAKGSGMIHPNMATMLSFITTDCAIQPALLQTCLKKAVDVTYNQITVDGDTSTNDMVVVMANAQAGNPEIAAEDQDWDIFYEAFHWVCQTLAKKIAADGEGATKLIDVTVQQATSALAARMMAKKIVGSALVKAAMFGEDPNWGRIVCAAGYAEQPLDPEKLVVTIGKQIIFQAGMPTGYLQEEMQETLAQKEIKLELNLGLGTASGQAWGCDLSYEYVKINACYHT